MGARRKPGTACIFLIPARDKPGMKTVFLIGLLALILTASAASCAANSYREACAACQFDAQGKIDQSCSNGYKASGTACVSTSYPITAAKYAKGECAMVDECASELQSCSTQYASGNDKADCQEGSLAVCYAAADECMKQAAVKCGEIQNPCGAPSFILLALLAGLVFVKI